MKKSLKSWIKLKLKRKALNKTTMRRKMMNKRRMKWTMSLDLLGKNSKNTVCSWKKLNNCGNLLHKERHLTERKKIKKRNNCWKRRSKRKKRRRICSLKE